MPSIGLNTFNKYVLYFLFVFPFLNYCLSLLLGVSIPYIGDILLILFLILISFTKRYNFKLNIIDFIIFMILLCIISFILINLSGLLILYSISEIRYIILIPFIYIFMRLSFKKISDAEMILEVVYKILKFNVILCFFEFILINFSPFSDFIVNRGLEIYSSKDRLYDPIYGNLLKPIGLFPGSGNSSIAISFFFVWSVYSKIERKRIVLFSLFSLMVTLTLTSLISVVVGLAILYKKKTSLLHYIVFGVVIGVLFYFSAEITTFRSGGFGAAALANPEDLSTSLAYIVSYDNFISEAGLFAHKFNVSSNMFLENLIGPTGEIYLLRVGIYFGIITLILFLLWMLVLMYFMIKMFKLKGKIPFFMAFVTLSASFHYPSINAIPLYIFLPLMSVTGMILKQELNKG